MRTTKRQIFQIFPNLKSYDGHKRLFYDKFGNSHLVKEMALLFAQIETSRFQMFSFAKSGLSNVRFGIIESLCETIKEIKPMAQTLGYNCDSFDFFLESAKVNFHYRKLRNL